MTTIGDAVIRDLQKRGVRGTVRERKEHSASTTSPSPFSNNKNMKVNPTKMTPPSTQNINSKDLTEEQKEALKKWNSLTKDQQKDLSAKYTAAVKKKKMERDAAKYRPKNVKKCKTGQEWQKWAIENDANMTETNKQKQFTPESPPIPATTSAVARSSSYFILTTTKGKIEASITCFLLAFVCTALLLPTEWNYTFTKQLCFGLFMGICVLTDQRGMLIACCRGFQGMTAGIVALHLIGSEAPILITVGSIVTGGAMTFLYSY